MPEIADGYRPEDFVDAFLENIDREVSPEIQRALAAGWPKLAN
jgi:hypothetical protein